MEAVDERMGGTAPPYRTMYTSKYYSSRQIYAKIALSAFHFLFHAASAGLFFAFLVRVGAFNSFGQWFKSISFLTVDCQIVLFLYASASAVYDCIFIYQYYWSHANNLATLQLHPSRGMMYLFSIQTYMAIATVLLFWGIYFVDPAHLGAARVSEAGPLDVFFNYSSHLYPVVFCWVDFVLLRKYNTALHMEILVLILVTVIYGTYTSIYGSLYKLPYPFMTTIGFGYTSLLIFGVGAVSPLIAYLKYKMVRILYKEYDEHVNMMLSNRLEMTVGDSI